MYFLISKTFPRIFLASLCFVSEKNEDIISKCAQWTQQSVTRAFQTKKDTGECSSTKLKSKCKNSGTFVGKRIYPKKSLTSVLHQAIQLLENDVAQQRNNIFTCMCIVFVLLSKDNNYQLSTLSGGYTLVHWACSFLVCLNLVRSKRNFLAKCVYHA